MGRAYLENANKGAMRFKTQMLREMFAFLEERERIYQRRASGYPWPWTDDPILRDYKFTNVYRENDKTTVWFRENVRNHYKNDPLLSFRSTLIFRWFNRISTGEILRVHDLLNYWDAARCRKVLKGVSPVVTGAYMLKSPTGMPKMEGIVQQIDRVLRDEKSIVLNMQLGNMLQFATEILQGYRGQGPFLAYEVITDLRHTFLSEASDIMTWANPGPGAMRGVDRLAGVWKPYEKQFKRAEYIQGMRDLLPLCPLFHEMRDVEHSLCEFDKYWRAKTGVGTPKARYHHE